MWKKRALTTPAYARAGGARLLGVKTFADSQSSEASTSDTQTALVYIADVRTSQPPVSRWHVRFGTWSFNQNENQQCHKFVLFGVYVWWQRTAAARSDTDWTVYIHYHIGSQLARAKKPGNETLRKRTCENDIPSVLVTDILYNGPHV